MSEQFIEQAQANMDAIERLLKGLPGISGYVDKELRRDADKRLREFIASQLVEQKLRLLTLQKQLLGNGGLRWLAEIDQIIQKLQTLTDRIRTASYGYAGLFDAVKIGEAQLTALHQFDTALATHVATIETQVARLQPAITNNESLQPVLQDLTQAIMTMDAEYNRRREAVLSPDLLQNNSAQ